MIIVAARSAATGSEDQNRQRAPLVWRARAPRRARFSHVVVQVACIRSKRVMARRSCPVAVWTEATGSETRTGIPAPEKTVR